LGPAANKALLRHVYKQVSVGNVQSLLASLDGDTELITKALRV